MRIGFIGLGNMGRGMAARLLAAGHDVSVWNRSAGKDAELVAAGATRAATPAEAAAGDAVLTMLADDRAVEAVVFGPDGIDGAPALHVSHSTISPALADRLTATGNYLSAPVFGRPQAAEGGKLVVAAAGPADLIDRCQPLFDAIGQRTFRIGDTPREANVVKLCGNFMIMAAVEAMAEAMTLAEKSGIDRRMLADLLTSTLFAAPIYQTYAEILVNDRFKPAAFAAPLGLKDMILASDVARETRVPMPLLAVVRDQLIGAIANEGEDVDWAGIATSVRRGAGLR